MEKISPGPSKRETVLHRHSTPIPMPPLHWSSAGALLASLSTAAANPLFLDADPTARVFDGHVYVYTTSELSGPERNSQWNIHRSRDLVTWEALAPAYRLADIPWRDRAADKQWGAWAPCAIEREGRYYLYGPVLNTDEARVARNSPIVLVADHPGGPFSAPLAGPVVERFHDPNIFLDDDGQAYLYTNSRRQVALLEDDMVTVREQRTYELGFEPPERLEAVFVFKRDGRYYFTYAASYNHLVYAIGEGPLGPFHHAGEIFAPTPDRRNNHHSLVEYQGRWILFYHWRHPHDTPPSPRRYVQAEYVHFEPDGSIRAVERTAEGVRWDGPLHVTIRAEVAPGGRVTFSADPRGGHRGLDVDRAYRWSFGDGATSTAAAPGYSYLRAGVYEASLALFDGAASATATTTVTIAAAPVVAPP